MQINASYMQRIYSSAAPAQPPAAVVEWKQQENIESMSFEQYFTNSQAKVVITIMLVFWFGFWRHKDRNRNIDTPDLSKVS